jgi:hypothetical protein
MVTTIFALVGLTLFAAPSQPLPSNDAFAGVASPSDVHTAVIKATVFLFQGPGPSHTTTGFFVWKRGADGRQRVFLVTAAHTFDGARPGGLLLVSARHNTSRASCDPEGWQLWMFDHKNKPRWLEDKKADIAVLEVDRDRVPCVAISVSDLATKADVGSVGVGDEVFMVGYPSIAASSAISLDYYGLLMPGHVAAYPVLNKADSAIGIYFNAAVDYGNSGSPLYWFRDSGAGNVPGTRRPRPVVVGVMTQMLQGMADADGGRPSLPVGFAALAAYARELIEKAK